MMECTKCTVPCTTLLVSNMVSTTQFATRASKRKQQKFSAILHASLEFSRKFPLKHSQSIEHFISICQCNVHYSSNNLLMNFTNSEDSNQIETTLGQFLLLQLLIIFAFFAKAYHILQ